ncbi:MAG: hypothetical protein ACRDZN_14015, partial [Acidimicrobiales bacterium]
VEAAASALAQIDDYYADQIGPDGERIAAQVARQLAEPRPHDLARTDLRHYRKLASRWHDWGEVVRVCRLVARAMLDGGQGTRC